MSRNFLDTGLGLLNDVSASDFFRRFEEQFKEHSDMTERMDFVSDCNERWPGTESNRRHTDFQSVE